MVIIIMENRATYKWWKELKDLIESRKTKEALEKVYARLNVGAFKSETNAQYNREALDYVKKEVK